MCAFLAVTWPRHTQCNPAPITAQVYTMLSV